MAELYDDSAARATLRFLVSVAAQQCGRVLVGGHTVGKGYIFKIEEKNARLPVSAEEAQDFQAALTKLIASDLSIEISEMDHAQAADLFDAYHMHHSVMLLRSPQKHLSPVTDFYNSGSHRHL